LQAHLQFAQATPQTKNCKRAFNANAGEKDWQTLRKIAEMHKARQVTACIVHLADSANFKGAISNKRCSSSTGSCFESPNDTINAITPAVCVLNLNDKTISGAAFRKRLSGAVYKLPFG